jgi:hypothetical protein
VHFTACHISQHYPDPIIHVAPLAAIASEELLQLSWCDYESPTFWVIEVPDSGQLESSGSMMTAQVLLPGYKLEYASYGNGFQ